MKVTVTEAHMSSFPNPIRLKKGEVVQVERRETNFAGWLWATTSDGNSGWTPEPILEIAGASAVVKEDYYARELDTQVGEELAVYRELNEWYWVSNAAGEYGWVPVRTVAKAE